VNVCSPQKLPIFLFIEADLNTDWIDPTGSAPVSEMLDNSNSILQVIIAGGVCGALIQAGGKFAAGVALKSSPRLLYNSDTK
jgi:hypothetical protein